jgi:hypothetical protein
MHLWKRSFSSAFPAKAGIQSHITVTHSLPRSSRRKSGPRVTRTGPAALDPGLRRDERMKERKCRTTPSGFRGRRNQSSSDFKPLASRGVGQPRPKLTALETDIYCSRTVAREVQETSETLGDGALAGVAIDASARGSRGVSFRTAKRASPSGNVPRGEANGDDTASGDLKPEGPGVHFG